MKKLMVIIFLMISLNSQATQNKFQFDAGLNLLVSSAKGYKINDVIAGGNYGVYLGAGYKVLLATTTTYSLQLILTLLKLQ